MLDYKVNPIADAPEAPFVGCLKDQGRVQDEEDDKK